MSSDPSILSDNVMPEGFGATDLVFGRTVVPVPNRNQPPKTGNRNGLKYEYAEHCFLGDSIKLTLEDGQKVAASSHKLQLNPELLLTYGQINGLAGDFYGTKDPISDGGNDTDRIARFKRAYETLANPRPYMPEEAMDILGLLQKEVDVVNDALRKGEDPSEAYAKELSDMTTQLQWATRHRADIPGYLGLAKINWDHFGEFARLTYNAGHAAAIQEAINGDLQTAYAMNAFADHFLEDSFASGHLRTPRKMLHEENDKVIWRDGCAKYMHDEDNAIGLKVTNPLGKSWTMYGDKRALDTVNKENKEHCVDAVQASADEVYEAYRTKQAPSPGNYQAWMHAPTLESARAHQELAPLFQPGDQRRKHIDKRREWEFTTNFWYWSTTIELAKSPLWNYPIHLD